MKRLGVFIIIAMGVYLAYQGVSLKMELNLSPSAGKTLPGYQIQEISRPEPANSFVQTDVFDIKRPASQNERAEGENDGKEGGAGGDGLNQIAEGDAVLRVRGIISSGNSRFAVLEVSGKKMDERESMKLFEGDQVRGYRVEEISNDRVELSKNGKERIRLKIFSPDQK